MPGGVFTDPGTACSAVFWQDLLNIGASKTTVRLIYVLLSFFAAGFPGLLVYIIFWIVTPEKPNEKLPYF